MSHPALNPAQRQAVEHHNGPILVLAGAGSGKTRVITHRIARLIERGVLPRSIVALTFTNKAAAEMSERVAKVVGGPAIAKQLTISTFHSFGLGVLTRERAAAGGTFTIFDQGDCLGAIKEIMSRIDAGKRFDAPTVMTRISNAKNAFMNADELPEREGDQYDEITRLVYPRYQAALRNFHAFDFDDLVCEVARIWMERKDILERWQERYRFILVDEYQDTNRAQLQLLRLLADTHKNICVVGDDDQSIYAWRGADVRNILEFEEHFPGATVVKLEQNYRSKKPILDVANAVISKRTDASKHKKTLFTTELGGAKVQVCVAASPEVESKWAAGEIKRLIRDEKRKPKDFAVLYRSNGQAKLMEEMLREQSVPYRVVGGQTFFERKEVKDILSYLKLALNRADEISLRRVINYPPRGIGETSIERLSLHALAKGWSLWQAVERVDALDDIASGAREGCKTLEKVIAETRRALLIERKKPSEAARDLCARIGLRAELDATSPSTAAAARRWANVESILGTFVRRETKLADKGEDPSDEKSFGSFLHALTLNFDDEEEQAGDAVTLSTLHGSKGLEFDVVFLLGCEEGLLPHSRTLDPRNTDSVPVTGASGATSAPADIEEERRLFYVGVTRAREQLHLMRAKARMMRGKPMARTPSRFLLEVPPELVDEREVKDDPAMSTAAMAESANALLAALEALR